MEDDGRGVRQRDNDKKSIKRGRIAVQGLETRRAPDKCKFLLCFFIFYFTNIYFKAIYVTTDEENYLRDYDEEKLSTGARDASSPR